MTKIDDALRLNEAERKSKVWDKVQQHSEAHLAAYRKTVENPNEPEAKRLAAAHRIDELKQLLRLAQPAREQPDDAE